MTTTDSHKVSVIIPARDAADTLPATIHSALTQSYKDIEVVLVDNGSVDDTPNIVSQFGNRVEYIRLQSREGATAAAWNIGLHAASGDFIVTFRAGDLMANDKIKEQMEVLAENPDIPLVFTNCRELAGLNESAHDFLSAHEDFQAMQKTPLRRGAWRIAAKDAFETLLSDNFIGGNGALFRKSAIDQVGYFDETLTRSEDIDLWLRMTQRWDVAYIERVLHLRRVQSDAAEAPIELRSKLSIFERQKFAPHSDRADRALNDSMAKLLFSIGHSAKMRGARMEAIRSYANSLKYNPTDYRIFLSILRALIPL